MLLSHENPVIFELMNDNTQLIRRLRWGLTAMSFVVLVTIIIVGSLGCSARSHLDKAAKVREIERKYSFGIGDTSIHHVHAGSNTITRCGDAPLVPFADMRYGRGDSLTVTIMLPTRTIEGKITGALTIITDSVEILYQSVPQSFPYDENIEEERMILGSGIRRNTGEGTIMRVLLNVFSPTQSYIISNKQLWNKVSITIDPADYHEITNTRELFFALELANCELKIFPNSMQIQMIQEFWFGDKD